jgi:glutaredoxin
VKRNILWFLVFVLAFATLAYADFYTWKDEDGTTHITDYPPPQNKKAQSIKVYKGDDAQRSDRSDAGQAKKSPDVMLFTKNECSDCDKAREFLKSKKITFTEYNMDKDKNAATRRKEIDDANDVPFAVIYRAQVYGFSEAVYNRALKSAP